MLLKSLLLVSNVSCSCWPSIFVGVPAVTCSCCCVFLSDIVSSLGFLHAAESMAAVSSVSDASNVSSVSVMLASLLLLASLPCC
jgi:hypothetical protein